MRKNIILGFIVGLMISMMANLGTSIGLILCSFPGSIIMFFLRAIFTHSPFGGMQNLYPEMVVNTVFYTGMGALLGYLVSLHKKKFLDDSLHCKNCGYNLTGNISGTCPECGMGIKT